MNFIRRGKGFMKKIKLNNLIFPIWMLIFIPPVIFIALIGNFIIDSLVVVFCFYVFKLTNSEKELKTFYRSTIFKVWIFGFLADIIGALLLLSISMFDGFIGLPYEFISAICYDPFSNIYAVLVIIVAMFISTFLIFIFNYLFTFRKVFNDEKVKIRVALTIAILTIPWTFLIPTKWFY
jgi:hypothetical protein